MVDNVKVIGKDGSARLIEWRDRDGLHRATIPASVPMTDASLESGIPWGEDFAVMVVMPSADDLVAALHERGIWTKADLLRETKTARDAAIVIAGKIIGQLIIAARQT